MPSCLIDNIKPSLRLINIRNVIVINNMTVAEILNVSLTTILQTTFLERLQKQLSFKKSSYSPSHLLHTEITKWNENDRRYHSTPLTTLNCKQALYSRDNKARHLTPFNTTRLWQFLNPV